MSTIQSSTKVGVYVDVENIARNGGRGLRYDILRKFACRDGAIPARLNAYIAYDKTRAVEPIYEHVQREFHSLIQDFGYKVIKKEVKWFQDDRGGRISKANADLDLAVDAILQSEKLDRVLLATGDGDFVQVVRALQNRGCRVEILAFNNVSADLRDEADMFMSGYLVPGLLPFQKENDNRSTSTEKSAGTAKSWGDIGSRVRGTCYHQRDNYGFIRFYRTISPSMCELSQDSKKEEYAVAFFHEEMLPRHVSLSELPSRSIIFEFELETGKLGDGSFQAKDMKLAYPVRP